MYLHIANINIKKRLKPQILYNFVYVLLFLIIFAAIIYHLNGVINIFEILTRSAIRTSLFILMGLGIGSLFFLNKRRKRTSYPPR
jgi:hypothetical protein